MGYLISRRTQFPSKWENVDVILYPYSQYKSSLQWKCAPVTLWYVACAWFFVMFPFSSINWATVPKDITVMWSATIQQQDMFGAGFACEAVDFLVPLASHVYLGWVNERMLNPFRAEDSAFHDLKPSDQDVLRTIYNQGGACLKPPPCLTAG